MADKAICPFCDAESSELHRSLRDEGLCPYCKATQEQIQMLWNAWETLHFDEQLETSPIIVEVIRLHKDNQQLMTQNKHLTGAMRGVQQQVLNVELLL